MKISVIIPTLDEEKYIENTIRQFRATKNICDLEVIVSDGGSNDRTVTIAREYADKVIEPSPQEYQNIAIGRNKGAKIANGEILFHTDADVIIPNIDEFFLKVIEVFEDPSVVAATTQLAIYPEQEKYIDKIIHFIFNVFIHFSIFIGIGSAKGECQFIMRTIFEKIGGYNEKIVVGEDANIFFRLRKYGSIVYLRNYAVFHSPRRFRNLGYTKVLFFYLREGGSLFFRRRSYLSEWKPER